MDARSVRTRQGLEGVPWRIATHGVHPPRVGCVTAGFRAPVGVNIPRSFGVPQRWSDVCWYIPDMKNLVILGAGTGGTIVANKLARHLPKDWTVTIVDPSVQHLYQPGLLFVPFGGHDTDELYRPRADTLDTRVDWRRTAVERVDTDARSVALSDGGVLRYDLLVIATGSVIRPDQSVGLLGPRWQKDIFDFYTPEGARALQGALANFEGGRLVLNVVEMPIKCPVAPLEFLFLADAYFTERGLRSKVEIVFATPLDGAFTRPVASERLGYLLRDKNIHVETEFASEGVEADRKVLRSYDGREVPYDLLVTVPIHAGAPWVAASGFAGEQGFIRTHRDTLAVEGVEGVYALGDATDVPASKAGSVAHFEAEVLAENLLQVATGHTPEARFDGHANCFVETGHGRAMLIDFNYDVEPLPGEYPVAGIGPFRLLAESRTNHMGKLGFEWLYWTALLPGHPLPVPTAMSMSGKHRPKVSDVPPNP